MKTSCHHTAEQPQTRARHRRDSGSIVIALLLLLTILLIYVTANVRTLSWLKGEIRLVEQRQVQRLQQRVPTTNAPPAAPRPATGSVGSRPD